MKLTIDFETRSAVDLSKTGPYPYAEHPSTSVMCLAFKEDNQPPRIWLPEQRVMDVQHAIDEESHGGVDVGGVLPLVTSDQIHSLITRAEQIEAHNVQFELAIWHHVMRRKFGFPDLPMHKLRDTAAVAAMHALPRKLEQVCQVLRLTEQKDMEGHALMLKMSKPRAPRKDERKRLDEQFSGHPVYEGMKEAYAKASKEKLAAMCRYATRNWVDEVQDMLLWNEDPKDIVRLCQYCLQDVQTEYALSQQLGDLPTQELKVFQHDLVVNTRGVQVDLQMARSALQLVDTHNKRLLAEMDGLTSGLVKSPKQNQVSRDWLATRGVKLGDLKAETVKAALKGELPEEARRFLEIRQSLSKSSTAKYEAAINQTCSDGRLRGFSMYHGAGTGRWTGKGIQLQNLPKGIFDLEKPVGEAAFWHAVDLVKLGGYNRLVLEFGDPMPILSSVIRPTLIAGDGFEMHAADFSAIEGRGLAWLAGEEWVLDAYRAYDTYKLDENGQRIPDGKGGFKREGPDMYIVTASKILGIPTDKVTKAQRKNPGKPGDLATGYQGGYNALTKFGATVPHESRAQWIAEWMRRRLKPKIHEAAPGYEGEAERMRAAEESALQVFEQYVAACGPDLHEDQLTPLRDQGWPYPTEAELFEIWGTDVVSKWRASRPKTVALWRGLEKAAIECVDTGLPCTYGPVTYRMEGMFCTCEIPSGRKLYYPFPKVLNKEMSWGGSKLQFSHMTVDADTKQWIRRFAHGGLLTENITQAICRDLLAEALLRLEAAGFPIIMHVHDEAVAEVQLGTRTLEEFEQIMTVVPAWAEGFPISAAGWVGNRYKKD